MPTHLHSGGTAGSSNEMESGLQITNEGLQESVIRGIMSFKRIKICMSDQVTKHSPDKVESKP